MVSSQSKIRTTRRSGSQFIIDAEKLCEPWIDEVTQGEKCLAGGSRPVKFRKGL